MLLQLLVDANTNKIKLTFGWRREKDEGLTTLEMTRYIFQQHYAGSVSERYLLKSVVFGSICAVSRGRQLVSFGGKLIIH